jgi:hypothetical protein
VVQQPPENYGEVEVLVTMRLNSQTLGMVGLTIEALVIPAPPAPWPLRVTVTGVQSVSEYLGLLEFPPLMCLLYIYVLSLIKTEEILC